MAEVTGQGLARGSKYAVVTQVWRIGSRLILTPLIISRIGLAGYGVWALLFSACAYVAMFQTSFGHAYSKFTAEYDAKKDYGTLSEIIGSGILLIGTVGVIGLTLLCLVRFPVLSFLGVAEEQLADAGRALVVVAFCVLMRMSVGCVFRILAGLQRVDLEYKMEILASAIEFAVTIILLIKGMGLFGLALGHLAGQVLATAVAWILVKRICPALRLSPLNTTRAGLARIGSLGGRFQLLAFLNTGIRDGVKLFIAALFGVTTLGVYELSAKLLRLAGTAGAAVIAPMMPAFANLHARGESRDWRKLYVFGSKLVGTVTVVSLGFIGLFADRAILLWTGESYPLAVWTLRTMSLGYYILLMTGVGTASLRARGTLRAEGRYLIMIVGYIALLAAPAYWFAGYKGIVGVIASGYVVGAGWFLVHFARREALGAWAYIRATVVAPVLWAAIPACAIVIAMRWIAWQASASSGRGGLAIELALWGIVFGIIVGLPIWFGVFSRDERARLRGWFGRGNRVNTASAQSSGGVKLDAGST